jgi:transposase
MTFMQDNASCHKTDEVMNVLEKNGVETLQWPPQSPDLNPIENLWAIIKDRRQKKIGMPTSKVELIHQVLQIWSDLEPGLAEKLAGSVVNRLKECLRRKGRQTKY